MMISPFKKRRKTNQGITTYTNYVLKLYSLYIPTISYKKTCTTEEKPSHTPKKTFSNGRGKLGQLKKTLLAMEFGQKEGVWQNFLNQLHRVDSKNKRM